MSLERYAKKRFLIVDELENFRFATKNALMSLGLKLIDTADSASKVLSSIKNVNYDVILCNFELGKGKNGQELLEELRYKKLLKFGSLFFIVTGEVAKDKVMGTIENEPDGYLVKPITPATLKSRLIKLLDTKEELKQVNSFIDEGNFKKALDACDELLESGTRYKLTCMKTKAWLLTKLGEVEVAKQLYQSILEKHEINWAEFALAKLCIEDEEYDRAESLLQTILEKEENRVEALDLLAKIYEFKAQPEKARAILENAISKSPNSLLRQKHYADLCISSGKSDLAMEAFRKVIKLGDQSIYAKPDQYFEFAEQLTKQFKDSDTPEGRRHIKEAFDLLGKAKKRFSDDNQIDFQVQFSEAALHYDMGNTQQAETILGALEEKLEKKDITLSPSSSRFAAKTLIRAGRAADAEKLLEAAADNAKGDDESVSEIYALLKSQISLEDRQKAANLNKNGIKEYNEGKINQAIKELEHATTFTPRHISLNLNLIQVLLKRMKKAEVSSPEYREDYYKCVHRFQFVRHVPRHHKEYKRLLYLRKLHQELKKPS